jgi:hypothetical protein
MSRVIKLAGLALASAMACSCAVRAQSGYRYYGPDVPRYEDSALRIARNTGYDDGSRMAYSDLSHYKPFDPYPRGKYAHEDHGYHREYGDKYAYRTEYERGYRDGYAATFRRR